MVSISEIPQLIRAKWSCVAYARDVLGLPIFKSGDRCMTPIGSGHTHNDSFWVHDERWHDFSNNLDGDVIAMSAYVRHNGDMGEAMHELGGEFFSGLNASDFRRHQESLSRTIERWHKALRPEDREYLHDRRIDDYTIDMLQIGYCGDEKSAMFDRIIVPYWQNGRPVYYAGRDCSGKWKDKHSGVSKYKKMFTRKNEYSENTIWGLHTLSTDYCPSIDNDSTIQKADYLCILEGMFDVMSFAQDGWHVLSPIGGHFAAKLMPMIKAICKRFKKVYICFDNDGPGVAFQQKMARFLFSNQIPFVCGHVPSDFNGQKIKDVSDYYAAGGSLVDLVENATPGITDLATIFHDGDEETFREFMLTAGRYASVPELKALCKNVRMDADYVNECFKEAKKPPRETDIAECVCKKHTLLYVVGDSFYEYEHGLWQGKPNEAIQLYAGDELGRFADIARMTAIARHLRAKKWTRAEFDTQNIVNCLNGVLDLETLELKPHNPGFMSTIQTGRYYDPKADCPRWYDFLDAAFQGDPLKKRCAAQIAGYIFFADCRLEKAFFLMGEGSNGKSVFIETLRYVVDPRNCSSVKIDELNDRFEPLKLRHSLVNFSTETQADVKGAESAIKTIASGETITAAHKGVDSITFKPRTKLIFACNNFLHAKDMSMGFIRKMKFLTFGRTFTPAEADTQLQYKLRDEASGILNWMINGYRDLRAMGHFVETADEIITQEQFMMLADPIAAFVRLKVSKLSGCYMSAFELYEQHYLPWQKKTKTELVNSLDFSKRVKRMLRMLLPHVSIEHRESGNVYVFPNKEDIPPF